MKQFDLEKYLENPNRKVVTRDGRSARIICTNRIDKTHSILALLFEDEDRDREEVYQYTAKGEYYPNAISPHDLCFAPIKKEGWVNMYKTRSGGAQIGQIYSSKEEAEMGRKDSNYISTAKIEWEE